jgi:hypothetical protein
MNLGRNESEHPAFQTPYSPRNPTERLAQSESSTRAAEFVEAMDFSKLSSQDINFIKMKGALTLPSSPVLDDLIRRYFLWVHPCLPLLDEGEFLQAYRRYRSEKISLFLLQAMLFASCAVSFSTL